MNELAIAICSIADDSRHQKEAALLAQAAQSPGRNKPKRGDGSGNYRYQSIEEDNLRTLTTLNPYCSFRRSFRKLRKSQTHRVADQEIFWRSRYSGVSGRRKLAALRARCGLSLAEWHSRANRRV